MHEHLYGLYLSFDITTRSFKAKDSLQLFHSTAAMPNSAQHQNSLEGDAISEKKGDTSDIRAEIQNVVIEDAVDPIYQAKARILNNAFQEMGMGKYQVHTNSIFSQQASSHVYVI